MLSFLHWNPPREVFSWNLPFLNRPLYWYGVFFAVGVFLAYLCLKRLLRWHLHKEAPFLDKLVFFGTLGFIIAARLFDVFFYQNLASYRKTPWEIFYVWEGGLASHGGALGLVLAIFLFFTFRKNDRKYLFATLDLITVPSAIAAGWIRIGNFFNQEILGTPSTLPWAVVFDHPMQPSYKDVPRHPVQLYESIFYFLLAFSFYCILCKKEKNIGSGRFFGFFLIILFTFRFFIENLKEEQSVLWNHSSFTMGQILSLPLIALGVWFIGKKHK